MSHCIPRRCRLHLFTNYARLLPTSPARCYSEAPARAVKPAEEREVTNDYARRVSQLQRMRGNIENCYPLLAPGSQKRVALADFPVIYKGLIRPTYTMHRDQVLVAGRIHSVRVAGSKLLFLHLKQNDHILQVVCKLGEFASEVSQADLKAFTRLVRVGDWYEVSGWPHRSQTGELSVLAMHLPNLLSPSLHQVPRKLEDAETLARNRHVDMLINPEVIQTMRVRHLVEQHLNDFFTRDGFIKVSTPILSASAGGAIARPFETEATEFDGQKLHLRIAPELWLKRLVVGGMEKVYEIGPAFRNEGVDATHNPEFYTCEFYEALATLDQLMQKTENLLMYMSNAIAMAREARFPALPPPTITFKAPFQRLEFIPTIERRMGSSLPDLSQPQAQDQLLEQFESSNIPIPTNPTLARLLDSLCAHYIEPICHAPTFITHHPAILSPLSKTTLCPRTNQLIATRAELFIQSREYANMYEEENSPFEQKRKFQQQARLRAVDGEGDGRIDQSYLDCLEWGLPPTGGWGCGIERLVMLFAGREKIGDVLSFGTLRNVVGLGKR